MLSVVQSRLSPLLSSLLSSRDPRGIQLSNPQRAFYVELLFSYKLYYVHKLWSMQECSKIFHDIPLQQKHVYIALSSLGTVRDPRGI